MHDDDSRTVIEQETNYAQDEATAMYSDGDDKTELYQESPFRNTYGRQVLLTTMDGSNQKFSSMLDGQIVLGRKHSEKGLQIDLDYSISKRHCVIYAENGKIFIQDLHSTNGTSVNNQPVMGNCEIRSGDTITLGRIDFRIDIL